MGGYRLQCTLVKLVKECYECFVDCLGGDCVEVAAIVLAGICRWTFQWRSVTCNVS